ncbi:MAG: hypothetical protein Rhims3KO_04260 [Hyphomicrobiales bacterium]
MSKFEGFARIGFTAIIPFSINQLNGYITDLFVDTGAFLDGGLGTVWTANGDSLLTDRGNHEVRYVPQRQ